MAAESLLEIHIFRHRHPPKSEWGLTLLTLPASDWASSSIEQESTQRHLSVLAKQAESSTSTKPGADLSSPQSEAGEQEAGMGVESLGTVIGGKNLGSTDSRGSEHAALPEARVLSGLYTASHSTVYQDPSAIIIPDLPNCNTSPRMACSLLLQVPHFLFKVTGSLISLGVVPSSQLHSPSRNPKAEEKKAAFPPFLGSSLSR